MKIRFYFTHFILVSALISCTNSGPSFNSSPQTFSFNSNQDIATYLGAYLTEFQKVLDSGQTNYPQMVGDQKFGSVASDPTLNSFNPNDFKTPRGNPAVRGLVGPIPDVLINEVDPFLRCFFPCVQFGIPGTCSNCLAAGCQVSGGAWACSNSQTCFPNLCRLPGARPFL